MNKKQSVEIYLRCQSFLLRLDINKNLFKLERKYSSNIWK